jgi:glycosyltransferase involved in cell wall biosynthesis
MNFLIVGGDPLDVNRVRRRVVEHKLQNVTLTGFVSNTDLPGYQSACDVLLMPYQRQVSASSGGDISRYLSPMKLFEYLACGRAICSSDLPVFSEVLSSDIAILLPPDEVNAWVAALQELSNHPLRRQDLATRAQRAAENFSWESRARKILAGIQEGNPE